MTRSLQEELKWLQDNPQFAERPATLTEFLGRDYLNIEGKIRKAILAELVAMIGKDVHPDRMTEVSEAMLTGAIGIGKTTVASVVLPYLTHWVLCLKDPQDFYGLLPGSRIAFMQMSTSETQAKEVVFGDIKARIEYSPWFQKNFPFDRAFKNQLRFEKDIWILPGDSKETTFEGYNILGGIVDEADSHQVTKVKDYAEDGFNTIHARMTSRFEDKGFILVIGQMKKANGFAARKFAEMKKNPKAHAVRMTIWESLGWDHYLKPDGTRDSFWYDPTRKEILPGQVGSLVTSNPELIEIPTLFKPDFMNNPEKALRDLAGIPPLTGSPFISLTYKVTEARDRWVERHHGIETPVDEHGRFAAWFKAMNGLKHVGHLDMAYSADGDALGFAMGHVEEVVEIDGEFKPYIVFDLLLRIHAPAGREIFLGDVRRIIYNLKDERKFRLVKVTMDGFQSTDTRQQLQKHRIESEIVSVDKQLLPYHDLREAIYENRVDFPRYLVRVNAEDTQLTEIAVKELCELVDAGIKVDHPEGGSKDVADAMAGVVYTLMGDRTYQRRAINLGMGSSEPSNPTPRFGRTGVFVNGGAGLTAPIPPPLGSGIAPWSPPNRGR